MKTISFKVKNAEIGEATAPKEYDLDTIFGGSVTEVKAISTIKLDDVYSLVTISATVGAAG